MGRPENYFLAVELHRTLLCRFQERRTWFQAFLAYFRVITFHVLWFHALLAFAFLEDDATTLVTCSGGVDSTGQKCQNEVDRDYSKLQDDSNDDPENPWNRRWMGISSVVITHAVMQLIYAYGVWYIRMKVRPPPAGQNDMRKQVCVFSSQPWNPSNLPKNSCSNSNCTQHCCTVSH
jgi:hypothetical protein